MKTLDFKPLDENCLRLIDEYLKDGNYPGSDYSYFAYLIWFETVEYAEGNGALFLRTLFDGKLRYWQPLVKGETTLFDAVGQLPPRCEFFNCSQAFAEEFRDDYDICFDRNYSEYIYLAEDFISLVGKRYNAKRNHIHKFKTLYNYEMRSYSPADRDAVLAFEEEWLEKRRFDDEKAERSAMREREIMFAALDAVKSGKTICDILTVDGKMAGFSVGQKISPLCAVIIYEKADISYDGIYSFLAHEFASRNFSDCKYINRQEDMGLEGLRRSKLSYCPEFLLDKYLLSPKRRDEGQFEGFINGKYGYKRLDEESFNEIMCFFKEGIASLSDKKFFLNYTDGELMEVLSEGHMLGAYDGDKLIATVAVDDDKKYGDMLARICSDDSGRQFYEFSGIMVREQYRGQGTSNALCKEAVNWARERLAGGTLCAVVQRGNLPSLGNLKKLGFEKRAEAPYGEYDFEYLTLEI